MITWPDPNETYLAFFVTLFAFFLLRSHDDKCDKINFLFASMILLSSIFIRPSVLLIPPVLMLVGFFVRNRKLLIQAFLLLCVCIIGFTLNLKISSGYQNMNKKAAVGYTTGVGSFIFNAYLLDTIVRTGKIEKAASITVVAPKISNQKKATLESSIWINDYLKKYPDAGSLQVLSGFIKDKPILVLRKLYLNPFFVFTLAERQIEFYFHSVIVLISLFFVALGMHYVPKDTKFWILAGIISGYLFLFVIVHAYIRYSVAVLPLLYVFAGKGFLESLRSMRKKMRDSVVILILLF